MSILLANANSLYIPLADKSVHCVVTSPPYYGLRDYGVAGQLGLEESPEQYIANMVAVFREVWRVLRDDGTIWVNIGDSYMSQPSWGRDNGTSTLAGRKHSEVPHALKDPLGRHERGRSPGMKPKDLIGIPWMLAFALRADGWYLRSDIIWAKPNPMPESVTDRPTKAHEYMFLLTKSQRYYYDNEAVKEDGTSNRPDMATKGVRTGLAYLQQEQVPSNSAYSFSRKVNEADRPAGPNQHREDREDIQYRGTRNRRTVWTIATEPTSEAHFATYPRKLVEPCIKAGCPAGGIVLDPFNGNGTTGIVARALGRSYVGLDLSLTYLADISRKRMSLDDLDAWQNGSQVQDSSYHDLPLLAGA
jgi:DNA modification methylase